MPQLEFSTFPSQIFWLSIFYGLIYLFVSRYITPAIFSIKRERGEKASIDSQKADLFIAESEGIKKSLLDLQKEFLEKERAILIEYKKDFEINLKKEEAKSERRIKKSIQNAQTSVNEEIEFTKTKLDELSYIHAGFLVKKLTGEQVTDKVLKKSGKL